MSKIKNVQQYEAKLHEANKEGRRPTDQASEKHQELEGETADYGQKLHAKETRRPTPKSRE
jgi:hypothetical protein